MNAEKLAYLFFRLNGCFTFENFIVHPDKRGPQKTESDLIAVRFQHRSELKTSRRPMEDHELFSSQPELISAFLIEAKRGRCELNQTWTDSTRKNLHRVLFAMGLLPCEQVPKAADALYSDLRYQDEMMTIQFVAAGRERMDVEPSCCAFQLTWNDMLSWIHKRFNEYVNVKANHQQWDSSAQTLFRSATRDFRDNENAFVRHWMNEIGVDLGPIL